VPGPACVYASSLSDLPLPNKTLAVSAAFTPAILKGMVVHPREPLTFDLVMDTGTARLTGDALRAEAQTAAKYFLAALTVPEMTCGSISPLMNVTALFPMPSDVR